MATKRPNNAPETEVPGDKSHKRQRLTTDSAVAFLGENNEPDPIVATATPEETDADDGSIGAMQDSTRVAVLVPFRDNHPAQKRRAHLDEFVPFMTEFMQRHCVPKSASFHIFILEQSLDGRKFNRGKLLNAGFDMARNDYDVFIFHDVDLLPGDDLAEFYTTVPRLGPMHVARVWDRYNESSNYFGGIVAFTRQQFIKVNGFPNNFWGWGGEDNELYGRVVRKKLTIEAPVSGTIRDLEELNLEEKLAVLRSNKWKCTVKHELLKEHHRTWKKNGLKSLRYEYVDAEAINLNCTKITVKLGPNGHWSDSRSSLERPTTPDEIPASYLVLTVPESSSEEKVSAPTASSRENGASKAPQITTNGEELTN